MNWNIYQREANAQMVTKKLGTRAEKESGNDYNFEGGEQTSLPNPLEPLDN